MVPTNTSMRFLAFSALLVAADNAKLTAFASSVEPATGGSPPEPGSMIDFEAWEALHRGIGSDRGYGSESERSLRKNIFQENIAVVQRHNDAFDAGHTSWKMTMNSPFADLTADEFSSLYLMDAQECSATTPPATKAKLVADTLRSDDKALRVDWRTQGIMTPVKDQGQCGSCWTFSTSGCLEAHTCLAWGKDCTQWEGFAEQQLIDCAGDFNNFGCNGGLPSQAYEYLKYNGGMDYEETYPYKAKDGAECLAKDGKAGGFVSEVYNITSGDEDDLVTAIAQVGPVSIAYQVSPDFRFYQHGVYDSYNATTQSTMCNNTNMDVNHAVVAVGLGTTADGRHNHNDDGGTPYYIVRNSWGTSWGMEGHFWMKRGENLCGVSDCASFPIVPSKEEMTQIWKEQKKQYFKDKLAKEESKEEDSLRYLRKN